MLSWNVDTKELRKNPKKYSAWRLTHMINTGSTTPGVENGATPTFSKHFLFYPGASISHQGLSLEKREKTLLEELL